MHIGQSQLLWSFAWRLQGYDLELIHFLALPNRWNHISTNWLWFTKLHETNQVLHYASLVGYMNAIRLLFDLLKLLKTAQYEELGYNLPSTIKITWINIWCLATIVKYKNAMPYVSFLCRVLFRVCSEFWFLLPTVKHWFIFNIAGNFLKRWPEVFHVLWWFLLLETC